MLRTPTQFSKETLAASDTYVIASKLRYQDFKIFKPNFTPREVTLCSV